MRTNISSHCPLPTALPLPPLAPSSLRIATSILSLTTNNFSYAPLGHLLGWWDVHSLPSSIPAEYSNRTAYGRISAWGVGTVLESTLSDFGASNIKVGTQVYGYLPIGTLPVDMKVEASQDVPGHFFEVSEERSKLMPIYNRYICYPPEPPHEDKQNQGLDSLFQVLYETGYMLNRFVFAWDEKELVQPGQELGGSSEHAQAWKFEDGRIGENTVMLLFAASTKTALSFAHRLKHNRPSGSKPRMIVAVGSDSSKAFTEGTGLYDKVLSYNADSTADLATVLGLDAKCKIVISDFGSRDDAANRWAEKLKVTYENTYLMGVGGEVVADSPEKTREKLLARRSSMNIQINASGMRSRGMTILGEKKYFEDFSKQWTQCKGGGVMKGLRLAWGQGMENVAKGWERLFKGEVKADEGLVFTLRDGKSGKL